MQWNLIVVQMNKWNFDPKFSGFFTNLDPKVRFLLKSNNGWEIQKTVEFCILLSFLFNSSKWTRCLQYVRPSVIRNILIRFSPVDGRVISIGKYNISAASFCSCPNSFSPPLLYESALSVINRWNTYWFNILSLHSLLKGGHSLFHLLFSAPTFCRLTE